ncbi:MAG: phytanoyl-CoA dioxygenase family protein [Planctomycetota bacterium]|nr:MAG: phytanoyl-CoA dioxygenase family protein [Planctomycetota bacterium]
MLLSQDQLAEYNENGYIIIKNFLTNDEIECLLSENDEQTHLNKFKHSRKDTNGKESKISLWNHPSDNIYGNIARSHKLVDRVEELLGGEVYHWHSKMMLKEAKTGGAWEWHQDYGYWYNNGCLTADLASCMMGINHSTKENGCLQVLKGSHKIGRIDHGEVGGQTGANKERVQEAEKKYEKVYVELDPGDALFFHSNLLHTSAPNESEQSRLVLICCYNKKDNSPFIENSGHPKYTPLVKINDDEILSVIKV